MESILLETLWLFTFGLELKTGGRFSSGALLFSEIPFCIFNFFFRFSHIFRFSAEFEGLLDFMALLLLIKLGLVLLPDLIQFRFILKSVDSADVILLTLEAGSASSLGSHGSWS
jgi:hypothetical protein